VIAPSVNPTSNRNYRSDRSFSRLSAVRVLVHRKYPVCSNNGKSYS
jgi:hypothetical protein